MKKAFTLAEIMIVLSIIGIITGILLPIAHQSLPDEKVMKFKKGHATLYKVINELVTSDKYHLDGDLALRPDGSLINDDSAYFCHEFADVVNAKKVNCMNVTIQDLGDSSIAHEFCHVNESWKEALGMTDEQFLQKIDANCSEKQERTGEEIVTSDGVIYFEECPESTFGISYSGYRLFTLETVHQYGLNFSDFSVIYKVVCIDVDGIGKGEEPFGYGVRADGKIIIGQRAQEWLEKDIQDKD